MKRTWLALLAAAVLAGGCGSSGRPATDEHDAVVYAAADYRATMSRFGWPRLAPAVTQLAAHASCRTAERYYRLDNPDAVAAAFARRARTMNRRHRISYPTAGLRAACLAGIAFHPKRG